MQTKERIKAPTGRKNAPAPSPVRAFNIGATNLHAGLRRWVLPSSQVSQKFEFEYDCCNNYQALWDANRNIYCEDLYAHF